MRKIVKGAAAAFLLIGTSLSFAEAPVVDANASPDAAGQPAQSTSAPASIPPASDSNAAAPTATTNMSSDQRLARLERQMGNLARMNLPQQISQLQQQIAQLRGQLEVQEHDLQLLNKQQRSFYQDLDNRINQMKNLNAGNNGSASGSSSNASPAKPDKNAIDTSVTSLKLKDASTYQSAFSQLTKRHYDKAKQALQNYLNVYPNGNYVADATYWLGEIYLVQKDYPKALTQFNAVIKSHPKSSKVVDAKLKVAIIHANTGKVEQARSELMAIKKQHPNSTAAQLANIRLQQLDAQKEQ